MGELAGYSVTPLKTAWLGRTRSEEEGQGDVTCTRQRLYPQVGIRHVVSESSRTDGGSTEPQAEKTVSVTIVVAR